MPGCTIELGPTSLATSITGVSSKLERVEHSKVSTTVGVASAASELTRCFFLTLADNWLAAAVFLFAFDLQPSQKSTLIMEDSSPTQVVNKK